MWECLSVRQSVGQCAVSFNSSYNFWNSTQSVERDVYSSENSKWYIQMHIGWYASYEMHLIRCIVEYAKVGIGWVWTMRYILR